PAIDLTTGLDSQGHVSLRSAIQAANFLGGSNAIHLPLGSYFLGDQIPIADNLTITGVGEGATVIDGQAAHRIFQVDAGWTVTLSSLSLAHGSSNQGGSITNAGSLTLLGCTVDYSEADGLVHGGNAEGGAIFNAAGAILTLLNGTTVSGTARGGDGYQ